MTEPPGELINTANPLRRCVYDAPSAQWYTFAELQKSIEETAAALGLERRDRIVTASAHTCLSVSEQLPGRNESNERGTPSQDQQQHKSLIFCFARNNWHSLMAYLTAWQYDHAICLLDGRLDAQLKAALIEAYTPDFIVDEQALDYSSAIENACLDQYRSVSHPHWFKRVDRKTDSSEESIHRELSLLLPTSGSTGSPKLVRLSRKNVLSNAHSIAQALAIEADDVTVTSLPLHYSYGLSVINSHLCAGASFILTEPDPLKPDYWNLVREQRCTSMAGVPYNYEMLNRLDLDQLQVPELKTLTQAGGKLSAKLIEKFSAKMRQRGGRFFVMYGQTEATARISILPSERLPEKLASVGQAIPGGQIRIDGDGERNSSGSGEVVYRGPNVMLGYAERRADLSLGDVQQGQLYTGDIGYLDSENFLYVTGRSKRIAKVLGYRLNLDDIEQWLSTECPVAAVAADDSVLVFAESSHQETLKKQIKQLAKKLKLHSSVFQCHEVQRLPRKNNGKVDYQRLVVQ